jgi:hypothetical protein
MFQRLLWLASALMLTGCGSLTLPAAVKLDSGEAFIGTTTAAVSGGTFKVADPKGTTDCSGNYDAFDTRPFISAPFKCSDGRYGTITVLRRSDGRGGSGTVDLAGGGKGRVAFGDQATSVLQQSSSSTVPPLGASAALGTGSELPAAGAFGPSTGAAGAYLTSVPTYSGSAPGRTYTGNCPTPDSYDSAGRRCGRRSAASKPGGYDGYGAWAGTSYSGGSTYVNGYFRKNGTYVRGHTRRR